MLVWPKNYFNLPNSQIFPKKNAFPGAPSEGEARGGQEEEEGQGGGAQAGERDSRDGLTLILRFRKVGWSEKKSELKRGWS